VALRVRVLGKKRPRSAPSGKGRAVSCSHQKGLASFSGKEKREGGLSTRGPRPQRVLRCPPTAKEKRRHALVGGGCGAAQFMRKETRARRVERGRKVSLLPRNSSRFYCDVVEKRKPARPSVQKRKPRAQKKSDFVGDLLQYVERGKARLNCHA